MLILHSICTVMDLQVMVPYNYSGFFNTVKSLVNANVIPMKRIRDAVKRILRVKFIMGLFENPLPDPSFANNLGSQVSRFYLSVHQLHYRYV